MRMRVGPGTLSGELRSRPEACGRAPRGHQPEGLARVDRGARGGLVRVPGGVDGRVLRPLGRQRLLGEDRVHRAFRLAGAAVDALVRVDEQLAIDAFVVVDAVDRADGDARDVEHVDARLGDHVGHSGPPEGRGGAAYPGRHARSVPPAPLTRAWRRPIGWDPHALGEVAGDVAFDRPGRRVRRGARARERLVRNVGRDHPAEVDALARGDDHAHAARRRAATLTTGVGPGRGAVRRRLGGLPGVLDRAVADDDLVDLEPAVDDVEQHGLARDEVEDRRQERVVLGDEVDLAGRVGRARPTGTGVTGDRPGSQAASASSDGRSRTSERARLGRRGTARSLRRALDAVPGTRRRDSLDTPRPRGGTVPRPAPGERSHPARSAPAVEVRLAVPTDRPGTGIAGAMPTGDPSPSASRASRSATATWWRSTASTSTSATASSSRCSARPARARPRCCG